MLGRRKPTANVHDGTATETPQEQTRGSPGEMAAAAALAELVRKSDDSRLSRPTMVRGLLADTLGEQSTGARREIGLLAAAADTLPNLKSGSAPGEVAATLSARTGMDVSEARWAVDTWVGALRIETPTDDEPPRRRRSAAQAAAAPTLQVPDAVAVASAEPPARARLVSAPAALAALTAVAMIVVASFLLNPWITRSVSLELASATLDSGLQLHRALHLQGRNGDTVRSVLELRNPTQASVTEQLTEDIPTSIAASASLIVFDPEPEILRDNPVVRWSLEVPARDSVVLTYEAAVPPAGLDVERLVAIAADGGWALGDSDTASPTPTASPRETPDADATPEPGGTPTPTAVPRTPDPTPGAGTLRTPGPTSPPTPRPTPIPTPRPGGTPPPTPPPTQPPVARDDHYTVYPENIGTLPDGRRYVDFNVFDNDSPGSNPPANYHRHTQATSGSVHYGNNQAEGRARCDTRDVCFVYVINVPPQNRWWSDSFTYTIRDKVGNTSTATVTFTIYY